MGVLAPLQARLPGPMGVLCSSHTSLLLRQVGLLGHVGDGVVLHHVLLDVVVGLPLLILLLYHRLSALLPGHHRHLVDGPGAVDGDKVRADGVVAPPCFHAS